MTVAIGGVIEVSFLLLPCHTLPFGCPPTFPYPPIWFPLCPKSLLTRYQYKKKENLQMRTNGQWVDRRNDIVNS